MGCLCPFWSFLLRVLPLFPPEFRASLNLDTRGYPGNPVVKTSPSSAGGAFLILIRVLRSHMVMAKKTKSLNRSNIVTNSHPRIYNITQKVYFKNVDSALSPSPQHPTPPHLQVSSQDTGLGICMFQQLF